MFREETRAWSIKFPAPESTRVVETTRGTAKLVKSILKKVWLKVMMEYFCLIQETDDHGAIPLLSRTPGWNLSDIAVSRGTSFNNRDRE